MNKFGFWLIAVCMALGMTITSCEVVEEEDNTALKGTLTITVPENKGTLTTSGEVNIWTVPIGTTVTAEYNGPENSNEVEFKWYKVSFIYAPPISGVDLPDDERISGFSLTGEVGTGKTYTVNKEESYTVQADSTTNKEIGTIALKTSYVITGE